MREYEYFIWSVEDTGQTEHNAVRGQQVAAAEQFELLFKHRHWLLTAKQDTSQGHVSIAETKEHYTK